MSDGMPTVEQATRIYVSDYVQRTKAKHRRARLRAGGWCLNGQKHGKATNGVLCMLCRLVHRGERESYGG